MFAYDGREILSAGSSWFQDSSSSPASASNRSGGGGVADVVATGGDDGDVVLVAGGCGGGVMSSGRRVASAAVSSRGLGNSCVTLPFRDGCISVDDGVGVGVGGGGDISNHSFGGASLPLGEPGGGGRTAATAAAASQPLARFFSAANTSPTCRHNANTITSVNTASHDRASAYYAAASNSIDSTDTANNNTASFFLLDAMPVAEFYRSLRPQSPPPPPPVVTGGGGVAAAAAAPGFSNPQLPSPPFPSSSSSSSSSCRGSPASPVILSGPAEVLAAAAATGTILAVGPARRHSQHRHQQPQQQLRRRVSPEHWQLQQHRPSPPHHTHRSDNHHPSNQHNHHPPEDPAWSDYVLFSLQVRQRRRGGSDRAVSNDIINDDDDIISGSGGVVSMYAISPTAASAASSVHQQQQQQLTARIGSVLLSPDATFAASNNNSYALADSFTPLDIGAASSGLRSGGGGGSRSGIATTTNTIISGGGGPFDSSLVPSALSPLPPTPPPPPPPPPPQPAAAAAAAIAAIAAATTSASTPLPTPWLGPRSPPQQRQLLSSPAPAAALPALTVINVTLGMVYRALMRFFIFAAAITCFVFNWFATRDCGFFRGVSCWTAVPPRPRLTLSGDGSLLLRMDYEVMYHSFYIVEQQQQNSHGGGGYGDDGFNGWCPTAAATTAEGGGAGVSPWGSRAVLIFPTSSSSDNDNDNDGSVITLVCVEDGATATSGHGDRYLGLYTGDGNGNDNGDGEAAVSVVAAASKGASPPPPTSAAAATAAAAAAGLEPSFRPVTRTGPRHSRSNPQGSAVTAGTPAYTVTLTTAVEADNTENMNNKGILKNGKSKRTDDNGVEESSPLLSSTRRLVASPEHRELVRRRRARRFLPPQESHVRDADYSGIDWLRLWQPLPESNNDPSRRESNSSSNSSTGKNAIRHDDNSTDSHDKDNDHRRGLRRLRRARELLASDDGHFHYLNSKDAFLHNLRVKRAVARAWGGGGGGGGGTNTGSNGNNITTDHDPSPSPSSSLMMTQQQRRQHHQEHPPAADIPLRTRVAFVSALNRTSVAFTCTSLASALLTGVHVHYLNFFDDYGHITRFNKYLEFIEREGLEDDDVLVALDSDVVYTGASPVPYLQEYIYASPRSREEMDTAMIRTGQHAPPLIFAAEKNCVAGQLFTPVECRATYNEYERRLATEADSYGLAYNGNEDGVRNPYRFLNGGALVGRVWAVKLMHSALRTLMGARAPRYEGPAWFCDQSAITALFTDLMTWELDQSLLLLIKLERDVGHLLPPLAPELVGGRRGANTDGSNNRSESDGVGGGGGGNNTRTKQQHPHQQQQPPLTPQDEKSIHILSSLRARYRSLAYQPFGVPPGFIGLESSTGFGYASGEATVLGEDFHASRRVRNPCAVCAARRDNENNDNTNKDGEVEEENDEYDYDGDGDDGGWFKSPEYQRLERRELDVIRGRGQSGPGGSVLRRGLHPPPPSSSLRFRSVFDISNSNSNDDDDDADGGGVSRRRGGRHPASHGAWRERLLRYLSQQSAAFTSAHQQQAATRTPPPPPQRQRQLIRLDMVTPAKRPSRLRALFSRKKITSTSTTTATTVATVTTANNMKFMKRVALENSGGGGGGGVRPPLRRALSRGIDRIDRTVQPFVHRYFIWPLYRFIFGYADPFDVSTSSSSVVAGTCLGSRPRSGRMFEPESAAVERVTGLRSVRIGSSRALLAPAALELTPFPPAYVIRFPYKASPEQPADNAHDDDDDDDDGYGNHNAIIIINNSIASATAAMQDRPQRRVRTRGRRFGSAHALLRNEFYFRVPLMDLSKTVYTAGGGGGGGGGGGDGQQTHQQQQQQLHDQIASAARLSPVHRFFPGDVHLDGVLAAEANMMPLALLEAIAAAELSININNRDGNGVFGGGGGGGHGGGTLNYFYRLLPFSTFDGVGGGGGGGMSRRERVSGPEAFDTANEATWAVLRRQHKQQLTSLRQEQQQQQLGGVNGVGVGGVGGVGVAATTTITTAVDVVPVDRLLVPRPSVVSPTRWSIINTRSEQRHPFAMHYSGGWKYWNYGEYKFYYEWYLPTSASPFAYAWNRRVLVAATVHVWGWEAEFAFFYADMCGIQI